MFQIELILLVNHRLAFWLYNNDFVLLIIIVLFLIEWFLCANLLEFKLFILLLYWSESWLLYLCSAIDYLLERYDFLCTMSSFHQMRLIFLFILSVGSYLFLFIIVHVIGLTLFVGSVTVLVILNFIYIHIVLYFYLRSMTSITVLLHHQSPPSLCLTLWTLTSKWSSTAFNNISRVKIFYSMTFYIVQHSIIIAYLNSICIIISFKRLTILVQFWNWTASLHIICLCLINSRLVITFSKSIWTWYWRCPCINKLLFILIYWPFSPFIPTRTKYPNLRNSLHYFLKEFLFFNLFSNY